MRKIILFSLICSMFLGPSIAVSSTVKIGSTCTKINQYRESGLNLLVCTTSKGKKVWRKATGVEKSFYLKEKERVAKAAAQKNIEAANAEAARLDLEAKAKAEEAAKPRVSLIQPTIASSFDFSGGKNLTVNLAVETNTQLDNPRAQLEFKVSSGQWSIPSQTRSIKGIVSQVSKSASNTDFRIEFDLTEFDPIGNYNIILEPFTSGQKSIDTPTNSRRIYPIALTRNLWRKGELPQLTPLPAYTYTSFKNEKHSRVPWVGRNVVLLTYSPDLDPNVMARILNALDAAYDTYKEVTQYTPGIARAYNGKISIAEMSAETVGCGAACGYLGATGIEIQTQLFLRLYNGVKSHDQFDEPLFYELGRNFWNYGRYYNVLVGSTGNTKWFDINTTGFAVFMRYFATEMNDIPIGPNDGPNKPGLEFKNDMLNLMVTQRTSTTDNFSSTFFSSKFDGYGFGVYGFWSSLIYYFMPTQGRSMYVKNFLASLSSQPSPSSIAQSVDNVVKSIGVALGRDISQEFYEGLHFADSKKL
jgi:hypothetical protein